MQPDLSNTNRQIQGNQSKINSAQRQSQIEREKADQRRQDGDFTTADYLEQQAQQFDQQIVEYQAELTQLEVDKERFETRIAELEHQKAQLSGSGDGRLNQINAELAKLRGLR